MITQQRELLRLHCFDMPHFCARPFHATHNAAPLRAAATISMWRCLMRVYATPLIDGHSAAYVSVIWLADGVKRNTIACYIISVSFIAGNARYLLAFSFADD